jgi:hypothetical protein
MVLIGSVSAASLAAQARRIVPSAKPKVPLQVALQVGSARYTSSSPGTCEHTDAASIYNVPSEQWRVEQQDEARSVTLTLWNPKDRSPQMVNFVVSAGSRQEVQTVRGPQPLSGTGKIAVEPAAKGGTFRLDLKTAKGTVITGTITCSAFTQPIAEGGN